MKSSDGYLTRAMRSQDPRYLQVLLRLGYSLPNPPAPTSGGAQVMPASEPDDESAEDAALKKAREEYERVVGKRPYYAWDAAELRRRIAEHLQEQEQEQAQGTNPPAPRTTSAPEKSAAPAARAATRDDEDEE